MFDRFSRDARAVVVGAQEESHSLGDTKVHAVHLLTALTVDGQACRGLLADHGLGREEILRWLAGHPNGHPGDGLDESALSTLGIDLDAVRDSVESTFGAGALDTEPQPRRRWPFGKRKASGHSPFTSGAKKALELSLREALRLQLNSIGVEAILLGILRADDPQVTRLLDDLGVDLRALRRATEDRLLRAA